ISRTLSPLALSKLAALMIEERYPAGADIVCEGDVADRLFVTVRGEADVIGASPGGPVHLTTLVPGDLFGELALLEEDHRRDATVRARTPMVVLALSQAAFYELMD